MINRAFILTLIILLGMIPAAYSDDYTDDARQIRTHKFAAWINAPIVISAIKAQNKRHMTLTRQNILVLDQRWRDGDKTLINDVLNNELSVYLRKIKKAEPALYTEIFIADNKGVNVGQSDITTDYWQGDEEKWTKTYLEGPDSMHISHIEDDESSKTTQLQVSLPILDKGKVIGTVTIGLNADMLE